MEAPAVVQPLTEMAHPSDVCRHMIMILVDEPPQASTDEQLEWWKAAAHDRTNAHRIFVTSRLHEADEIGHILTENDDNWDVLKL